MSRDFWKPDLSSPEKRRLFGFELAERLIRGQTDILTCYTPGVGQRNPNWTPTCDFADGQHYTPIDQIQLLAIEVLRHYASGQPTPPHLAHSFLDECMATLGEDHSPVTERWLADRGFACEHDYPNWRVKEYKLPGLDEGFHFFVSRSSRAAESWGIEDAVRDQSVGFAENPTVAQVLTVGRALGIPTERRT